MQIKFSNRGTTLIAKISGELDHHSAEYIKQKLEGQILKSTTKNLIFDFTGLTFMDSSGIGVIMGRYKNIKKLNGKTSIVTGDSQTERILKMCGINKFINIHKTLDSAIRELE